MHCLVRFSANGKLLQGRCVLLFGNGNSIFMGVFVFRHSENTIAKTIQVHSAPVVGSLVLRKPARREMARQQKAMCIARRDMRFGPKRAQTIWKLVILAEQ